MAKYPIPVNVTWSEKGSPKIVSAKKRVEELGANAFIVSKASMKKLEKGPESALDADAVVDAVMAALKSTPAANVPRGAAPAIRKALAKIAG